MKAQRLVGGMGQGEGAAVMQLQREGGDNESIASAPGKILWLGGYAVLERPRTAFVSAVDRRVHAAAKRLEDTTIRITAPQLGLHLIGSIVDGKIDFHGGDIEARFVARAIEACASFLGSRFAGAEVETHGDEAFAMGSGKSGLGSSSAVTVATVAAVLQAHGFDVGSDEETVHKLSQYAHSKAQGKVGSGFDVAAATYGTCTYSRYSPKFVDELSAKEAASAKWDYSVEPVVFPPFFRMAFGNFVGTSTSTTKMVNAVTEFKEKNEQEYWRIVDGMEEANKKAIAALRMLERGVDEPVLAEFRLAFNTARDLAKELGRKSGVEIEGDAHSKLIDETINRGAFVARLPGAGGGDAIAALCMSEGARKSVLGFWAGSEFKIEPIELNATNEGVRIEEKRVW